MGYDNGELKAAWEIEAELKRVEDRRDYERELAGIDIGRTARFHDTEFIEDRRDRRSGASQSHRSSQREFASRLQMLLATNAAYATSYQNAFTALTDAENAAEQALAKLEAARNRALQEVEDMLGRAARLPDGRRVFKDKRGQIWDEHGTQIDEEAAASIHWRGDEPTHEEFSGKKGSATKLDEAMQDIRRGQVNVLGKIREELSDGENPPSNQRVDELGNEARRYHQELEGKMADLAKEPAMQTSASEPVIKAPAALPTSFVIPP